MFQKFCYYLQCLVMMIYYKVLWIIMYLRIIGVRDERQMVCELKMLWSLWDVLL